MSQRSVFTKEMCDVMGNMTEKQGKKDVALSCVIKKGREKTATKKGQKNCCNSIRSTYGVRLGHICGPGYYSQEIFIPIFKHVWKNCT